MIRMTKMTTIDEEVHKRNQHKKNTYNNLKKGMPLFIMMHYLLLKVMVIAIILFWMVKMEMVQSLLVLVIIISDYAK